MVFGTPPLSGYSAQNCALRVGLASGWDWRAECHEGPSWEIRSLQPGQIVVRTGSLGAMGTLGAVPSPRGLGAATALCPAKSVGRPPPSQSGHGARTRGKFGQTATFDRLRADRRSRETDPYAVGIRTSPVMPEFSPSRHLRTMRSPSGGGGVPGWVGFVVAGCGSSIFACAGTASGPAMGEDGAAAVAICGARLPGGVAVDLEIRGGRVSAKLPAGQSESCREIQTGAASGPAGDDTDGAERAEVVDGRGHWLSPAFIDSHVHLVFFPDADQLPRAGVAAAVDLAAPLDRLPLERESLRTVVSGPMLTPPQGYPTQSWGRDGYGLEVADLQEALGGVDSIADAGARVLKIPVDAFVASEAVDPSTTPPVLDEEALTVVVARAHERGMTVAVHALGDASADLGARIGADLLAHVPLDALSEATVDAWSERAVIPTLSAFGAGSQAIENLRRLHEAGSTILYGTDLGNARTVAISAKELAAMGAAGMTAEEVLASGTSVPAAYWAARGAWSDAAALGSVDVASAASLLLLDADPLLDPSTLERPERVMIDGRWLEPLVAVSPGGLGG